MSATARWAFAALALLGVAQTQAADGPVSFAGTLGKLEVVACLDPATREGSYYYPKIGKTIQLQSGNRPSVLIEAEPGALGEDGEDAAQWHIRTITADAVAATWQPAKGARRKQPLEIALHRIGAGCGQYERRRLDVPERRLPRQPNAGMVEFYRHGLADVVGVRLVGGVAPAVMAKVNAALAEFFRHEAASSFDCREYSGSAGVELYRELLVVDYHNGYYCGGAHPNEDYSLLLFDLRSGARLKPDDWLYPYDTVPVGAKGRLDGALLALVDDPECRAALQPLAWWPSAKGAMFRLWSDARATAACREDVMLPLAAVRPFVKPAFREEFDAWSRRVAGTRPVHVSPPLR